MLKLSYSIFIRILGGVFGWFFIVPIAILVPKRRDWIGVYGRQDGRFLDNAKYFFLQASEEMVGTHFVFITERRDTADTINSFGCVSYCYPGFKTIWFLLRCGSFVVDEVSWYKRFRFYLLFRANIVQLWHGVPFKWIELGLWKNQTSSLAWASTPTILKLRLFLYKLTGRWVCYSAVVTTSEFYCANSFIPSFESRLYPVLGYPRNDFAKSLKGNKLDLAWSNVDDNIRCNLEKWLSSERKIVLVAPTFRDSGAAPMRLDSASLEVMEKLAEKNGIEFVFKFHPSEKNVDNISGRYFHVCDRESDVYPILPYLSALVTDYSSIGMDFLLVDKPLIFLIPDGDDYLHADRKLQFDPRAMMPGPVISSWDTLLQTLLMEWDSDTYKDKRARLRDKTFDGLPQSEAVPKLLEVMRVNGWIK